MLRPYRFHNGVKMAWVKPSPIKELNMRKMLRNVGRGLKALHRDEGGAEMLEYILIVAVIALPLVGLLIVFRENLVTWFESLLEEVGIDEEMGE